jgi:hypothetical protein
MSGPESGPVKRSGSRNAGSANRRRYRCEPPRRQGRGAGCVYRQRRATPPSQDANSRAATWSSVGTNPGNRPVRFPVGKRVELLREHDMTLGANMGDGRTSVGLACRGTCLTRPLELQPGSSQPAAALSRLAIKGSGSVHIGDPNGGRRACTQGRFVTPQLWPVWAGWCRKCWQTRAELTTAPAGGAISRAPLPRYAFL